MAAGRMLWINGSDKLVRYHGDGMGAPPTLTIDLSGLGATQHASCTTDHLGNLIVAASKGGVTHLYRFVGLSNVLDVDVALPADYAVTGVTWDGENLLTCSNTTADAGDQIIKWNGFSAAPKESFAVPDINPVGICWTGTHTIIVGRWRLTPTEASIRRYRGFSLQAEEADLVVGFINPTAADVSWDGSDLYYAGDDPPAVYRLDGWSTTVVETYLAPAQPDGMEHGIYSDRNPQPTTIGPYAIGSQTDRLMQFLGWSSSLRRFASVAAIDFLPKDLTWDGTDFIIAGDGSNLITKLNGFSGTLKDWIVATGNALEAITWDGENLLSAYGGAEDRVDRHVGFSGIIDSSVSLAGVESGVRGITWRDGNLIVTGASGFTHRMVGFSNEIDATIARWGHGISYNADNPLLLIHDYPSAGRDAVVELDGFSADVLRYFDVDHVDAQMTGIEHHDLAERLGLQNPLRLNYVTARRRHKRTAVRRPSSRPALLTGESPAVGGWPLTAAASRRRRPTKRRRRPAHPGIVPLGTPVAVVPALTDLVWLGSAADTVHLIDGFSGSIKASVNLSGVSTGLAGVTWDGTDLIVADLTFDRIVKLDGFSSVIKDSVPVPDTLITGVSWDGTDLRWTGDGTNALYRMVGFSTQIRDSVNVGSITGSLRGCTSVAGDPLFLDFVGKIAYRMAGYSLAVRASVDLSGLSDTGMTDLTWDGQNLILTGLGNDKLYRMVGFSAVLDAEVDVSGTDSGPWGIETIDYALRGGTVDYLVFPAPRARRIVRQRRRRASHVVFPPTGDNPEVGGWPLAYVRSARRARKGAASRGRDRNRRKTDAAGVILGGLGHRYWAARGKHRVFGSAGYRMYRSSTGPPLESQPFFGFSQTLPYSPANTFPDGTWYVSMSYFNGVIDSGFLPLGPNGETWIRIDVAGGVATGKPPKAPIDARLVVAAGGVIRVMALYHEDGADRADEWALTWTTNGSDPGIPPAVAPTTTIALGTLRMAILEHDLPAQSTGTVVKVRVQVRRDDAGSWAYSENPPVLTAVADATGPSSPHVLMDWPGLVPEI